MQDILSAGKKTRILIVEDELIIAKGIQKRLQSMGYSVIDAVPSGEEAVLKAATDLPDLILMDINLQGNMDGVEAAEKIRSQLDIPVIYLTAYTDSDSLSRAKITEPFGYIVKPFQDLSLQSGIEIALYKHRMESRLRQSEQWLATTLQSIGDAVVTTDVSGVVTYMNHAAESLIGWQREEALGRSLTEVFRFRSEETSIATAEIAHKVVSEGETVILPGDAKLLTKSGEEVPIVAKATPIVGNNGHIMGLVLVLLDITERKRAEEALQRSERILTIKNLVANIFLTIPDEEMYGEVINVVLNVLKCPYGFFGYIDENGGLVIPSFTKDVWQECQVHGKTISFNPEKWGGLWGRALREQKTFSGNGPFIMPEGHVSLHNFLTSPIVYRHKTIGIISVGNKETGFTDDDMELLEAVTDRIAPILQARLERDRQELKRRLAEEALRQSEKLLRHVFDGIPDLFAIIGRDYRIILANWHGGYEYVPVEIRDKHPFCYEAFYGTDTVCENCHVKEVFRTGRPFFREKYNPQVGFVEIRAFPIFDEEGNVVMVTEHIRDITEKKKMEEELFNARKLESIGILAGGIAHDFNNLLTAILGNISLSKMFVPEGETVHQRLSEAEKASLRARDLTQQLLTFSRGGAPVRKIASIVDIIKDSSTFTLSGSRVTCRFDIPDDLYPVEVDEGQISQVINNLVINAAQAMPEGGEIEISCVNVSVDAEQLLPLRSGIYVLVSVKDQGEGISEEVMPRIFDPYFSTKESGKGLGLATVYSIVKNHDGHISVTSQQGAGTIFNIYLPAAVAGIVEQTAEEIATPAGKGKILVMDDEEVIRDIAGEMLSYLGYDVEFARDGEEAAELYRLAGEAHHPFSAVLMDLTIPGGMGGKDAIKVLREIDGNVKAIVSSGYSNDPIMADYRAFGFQGVITKPYKVTELKKILDEVAGKKG